MKKELTKSEYGKEWRKNLMAINYINKDVRSSIWKVFGTYVYLETVTNENIETEMTRNSVRVY